MLKGIEKECMVEVTGYVLRNPINKALIKLLQTKEAHVTPFDSRSEGL